MDENWVVCSIFFVVVVVVVVLLHLFYCQYFLYFIINASILSMFAFLHLFCGCFFFFLPTGSVCVGVAILSHALTRAIKLLY